MTMHMTGCIFKAMHTRERNLQDSAIHEGVAAQSGACRAQSSGYNFSASTSEEQGVTDIQSLSNSNTKPHAD